MRSQSHSTKRWDDTEDYQANPITLGRRTGEKDEPTGLVAAQGKILWAKWRTHFGPPTDME